MAKASSAKRHNRLIGLVVVLVLIAGWASWYQGNRRASSTAPLSASDVNEEPGISSGSLARPADVSLSWFNHSLSVEQFDYEMPSLSCKSMAQYITPDLCVIADGERGSFMVVGTEGYWDPQDADSSGRVWVPMDLTVYVLTKENGKSRAMSVLDGSFQVNYDGDATVLNAYVVETSAGQVVALHKKGASQAAQAYDFWDEVQFIGSSKTGAPDVVAAYEGSNIHLSSDGKDAMFSSDRYASPTGSSREPKWSTFTWLSPTEGGPWMEVMRSGESLKVAGSVKPVLADSYVFPNSADKGSDA